MREGSAPIALCHETPFKSPPIALYHDPPFHAHLLSRCIASLRSSFRGKLSVLPFSALDRFQRLGLFPLRVVPVEGKAPADQTVSGCGRAIAEGAADVFLLKRPALEAVAWELPVGQDHAASKRRHDLAAVRHLAPGGRLVYATCSLLQEENERQLAWFLENHADFQALPIDQVWAETVGGPPPPTGPALRLSPASTGTDGFFCAVMERK